nr:hypothetical protein HmN_001014600 [Hymenolepis microstoma]CUU98582.1 hypothetical transcript [Hymenolepis microstoma]
MLITRAERPIVGSTSPWIYVEVREDVDMRLTLPLLLATPSDWNLVSSNSTVFSYSTALPPPNPTSSSISFSSPSTFFIFLVLPFFFHCSAAPANASTASVSATLAKVG